MNNSRSAPSVRAMLRTGAAAFLLGTFVVTPALVVGQGATPQRRAARGADADSLRPARTMPRAAARNNAAQRGRSPAASILAQREYLKLTDDQVNRLNTVATSESPGMNEPELLRARADLIEATKRNINLSAARAALDKMSRVTNERTIAALKLKQDARNVLTAEQIAQLDARQSRSVRGNNRANNRVNSRANMRGRTRHAPGRHPTEFRRR